MMAYLGLMLAVVGTIVVMAVLPVAVVVDVVVDVVAIVAILGNVSVVDVHVGLMIVATPPAALLGQRGLTPAPV
jgi:hypothetical protein